MPFKHNACLCSWVYLENEYPINIWRKQLDEDHFIFKKVLWTFKLCIDDFKFCKPTIQVDGTFLYGKYRAHFLSQLRETDQQDVTNCIFHNRGWDCCCMVLFLAQPTKVHYSAIWPFSHFWLPRTNQKCII